MYKATSTIHTVAAKRNETRAAQRRSSDSSPKNWTATSQTRCAVDGRPATIQENKARETDGRQIDTYERMALDISHDTARFFCVGSPRSVFATPHGSVHVLTCLLTQRRLCFLRHTHSQFGAWYCTTPRPGLHRPQEVSRTATLSVRSRRALHYIGAVLIARLPIQDCPADTPVRKAERIFLCFRKGRDGCLHMSRSKAVPRNILLL